MRVDCTVLLKDQIRSLCCGLPFGLQAVFTVSSVDFDPKCFTAGVEAEGGSDKRGWRGSSAWRDVCGMFSLHMYLSHPAKYIIYSTSSPCSLMTSSLDRSRYSPQSVRRLMCTRWLPMYASLGESEFCPHSLAHVADVPFDQASIGDGEEMVFVGPQHVVDDCIARKLDWPQTTQVFPAIEVSRREVFPDGIAVAVEQWSVQRPDQDSCPCRCGDATAVG